MVAAGGRVAAVACAAALAMSHLGGILADPSHPLAGTNYWLAGDDAYCGNANLSNNIFTP
jgi:hypothetical protein